MRLQGLDIGPQSQTEFKAALKGCRTVLWNGPMGVFEFDKFAVGTFAIAQTVAELTGQVCGLPTSGVTADCLCDASIVISVDKAGTAVIGHFALRWHRATARMPANHSVIGMAVCRGLS